MSPTHAWKCVTPQADVFLCSAESCKHSAANVRFKVEAKMKCYLSFFFFFLSAPKMGKIAKLSQLTYHEMGILKSSSPHSINLLCTTSAKCSNSMDHSPLPLIVFLNILCLCCHGTTAQVKNKKVFTCWHVQHWVTVQ